MTMRRTRRRTGAAKSSQFCAPIHFDGAASRRRINVRGRVMNFAKPFAPSAVERSNPEVGDNIRELERSAAVSRRGENREGEMSSTGLGSLLRRVSGDSKRELDALIGELQMLREKLEGESRRLQNDISEYASLS